MAHELGLGGLARHVAGQRRQEQPRGVERLQQIVAGGGEEAGLRRRGGLGLGLGFSQRLRPLDHPGLELFVGGLQRAHSPAQLCDVGIAGQIAAIRDRRAGQAQHAAVRAHPLADMRLATTQVLEPALHKGVERLLRHAVALGVEADHVGDGAAHMHQLRRQVEHLQILAVPGDEAQFLIHHADPLAEIVEGGLQQLAIELHGLRRAVDQAGDVLRPPLFTGQGLGHHPPRRGRPDGPGQHQLCPQRHRAVDGLHRIKAPVQAIAQRLEAAPRGLGAQEARHHRLQPADLMAERHVRPRAAASRRMHEGLRLHEVDRPRLRPVRDEHIDRRVGEEADQRTAGQGVHAEGSEAIGHRKAPPRLRPHQLRRRQEQDPESETGQKPRHCAPRMPAGPVDPADQRRRELGHRCKRNEANGGEVLLRVQGQRVEAGDEQQRGNRRPPRAHDGRGQVLCALRIEEAARQHRQHELVRGHGRQGHRLHHHHRRRRREPAEIDERCEHARPVRIGQRQHEHVGIIEILGREPHARARQRRDGQAGEREVQRKRHPRGGKIGLLLQLHKADVELPRQAHHGGGGEEDLGQERKGQVRRGRELRRQDRRVVAASRQQDQREDRDGQEGGDLDEGLGRDGADQTRIMLRQLDPPRAEDHGEDGEHGGGADRDGGLRVQGPREHREGHGQGAELQGDVGRGADQADRRRNAADQRALAIAGGQKVRDAAGILPLHRAGDALPQRKAHRENEGRTDIDGQIVPTRPHRCAHRAEEGPGGAVDRQRQTIDEAPLRRARLCGPPLRPPGDRHQERQIDARQSEQGKTIPTQSAKAPLKGEIVRACAASSQRGGELLNEAAGTRLNVPTTP